MPVRLFVGNLPYDANEAELREHFAQAGQLSHVFIPVDRETGRPRGFAFVEFAERAHAEDAITRLNSRPFKGRPLSVSEARAREDRPTGGPGPRPGGPPSGGWSPRPPGAGIPSGPPPGSGPGTGEPRRREFGPDAPPKGRGRGKMTRGRREEKVGGPIPIKAGGRIYDVDDLEDAVEEPVVEDPETDATDLDGGDEGEGR